MGRTSPGDNLSLLRPESLAHSLHVRRIVAVIEGDGVYRGRNPRGEPQSAAAFMRRYEAGARGATTKCRCYGC